MGISEDLGLVLDEIGNQVVVLGTSPTVSEYIDYEETDRWGVFSVSLRYNSTLKVGDVISSTVSAEKFIICTLNDELFENAGVTKSGFMMKCLFRGVFRRPSTITNTVTREKTISWNQIADTYVVFDSKRQKMNGETNNVIYPTMSSEIICQSSIGVQPLDRVVVNNVNYQIGAVDNTQYKNISVCEILKDTR